MLLGRGGLLVIGGVGRFLVISRSRMGLGLRLGRLVGLAFTPACVVLAGVVPLRTRWVGAQRLLVWRWARGWRVAASVALVLGIGVVGLGLVLIRGIWVGIWVALGVAASLV